MRFMLAIAVAAILAVPVRADEAPKPAAAKSSWSDFFKNLKNSLGASAVSSERKKGAHGANGVSAVRGDDLATAAKTMADPNEPGLKGDSKTARMKKELGYDKDIDAGVELIKKEDYDGALKTFEAFKKGHPKYRVEDLDKAIEGAKALKAEKVGATAPAEPAKDTKE